MQVDPSSSNVFKQNNKYHPVSEKIQKLRAKLLKRIEHQDKRATCPIALKDTVEKIYAEIERRQPHRVNLKSKTVTSLFAGNEDSAPHSKITRDLANKVQRAIENRN